MQKSNLRAMQENHVDQGRLQIQVRSAARAVPVEAAQISISYTGDPERTVEQITTNANG